jgi:hypothetical protein
MGQFGSDVKIKHLPKRKAPDHDNIVLMPTHDKNHRCCVVISLLSKYVEGNKYNIHTNIQ